MRSVFRDQQATPRWESSPSGICSDGGAGEVGLAERTGRRASQPIVDALRVKHVQTRQPARPLARLVVTEANTAGSLGAIGCDDRRWEALQLRARQTRRRRWRQRTRRWHCCIRVHRRQQSMQHRIHALLLLRPPLHLVLQVALKQAARIRRRRWRRRRRDRIPIAIKLRVQLMLLLRGMRMPVTTARPHTLRLSVLRGVSSSHSCGGGSSHF